MIQLDNGKGLEANNDSFLVGDKKTARKDWYALTLSNYQHYKNFEMTLLCNFTEGWGKMVFRMILYTASYYSATMCHMQK